jgi:hypothetical protein
VINIEDKKENPLIRKILDKLTSFFPKEKKIERIRVIAGTNKFWCSAPEKVKFWKGLAEHQAHAMLFQKEAKDTTIRITKVIYK